MKKTVASLAVMAALLPTFSVHAEGKEQVRKSATTFNVISDIQGDLGDFDHVLKDMNKVTPLSRALIMNGDITPTGQQSQYDDVKRVLNKNKHPENVWSTVGNHEFYAGKWTVDGKLSQNTWPNGVTEETLFGRYLQFSGQEKVYHKKELDGYPLLFLGTEKYMKYHDSKMWDEVYMSDEQLGWLKQNLEEYSQKDKNKPIFIFSHHVLPDTVSGSRQSPYLQDYLNVDKLYDILKDYPQVVFFASHTHWDLNLPDWAGKKKIKGGDEKGFTVVNTGGIETGWMSAGPNGGEKTAPDGYSFKQGLQVKAYGNDVVVTAYDYKRDKDIKKLLISDSKIAQMAPNVTADDSKNIILGTTEYMEYSIEGTNEWHTYNKANPPKFDGDKTVYVRHKGEMNLEPGLTQLLRFSVNK